jgi:hypothetical protein
MSYFAEIDENNIVIQVIKGDDNLPNEGYDWIAENLPGRWIKTSFTSRLGNRIDPVTGEVVTIGDHFRLNFGCVGYIYDEDLDAFILPKPHKGWILNQATGRWDPPIEEPTEGEWRWDDESESWLPA